MSIYSLDTGDWSFLKVQGAAQAFFDQLKKASQASESSAPDISRIVLLARVLAKFDTLPEGMEKLSKSEIHRWTSYIADTQPRLIAKIIHVFGANHCM